MKGRHHDEEFTATGSRADRREEDYGDDVVCDMQVVVCDTCRGYGGWNQCGNDAKWCEENPIPGRENVKRGTLEWFRDYQEEQ